MLNISKVKNRVSEIFSFNKPVDFSFATDCLFGVDAAESRNKITVTHAAAGMRMTQLAQVKVAT